MDLIEQLLIGALGALMVLWFWPAVKAAAERSREAPKDWTGALIPMALVVLFVILLVMLARGTKGV
ncbi:conserved hypothetical protein [Gammaproteobacteria bacterium]